MNMGVNQVPDLEEMRETWSLMNTVEKQKIK